MKKIMFNDQYRLTEAVLEGRKTQTRRILGHKNYTKRYIDKISVLDAKYKVGEIVAVAQSYKDAGYKPCETMYRYIPKVDGYKHERADEQKGWNNKLYVAANLMPHQIKITNVRIQRLQDISDEDCLAEGVKKIEPNKISNAFGLNNSYEIPGQFPIYETPREAYATLIDMVSGKGTWESNPWVFVYEFELVK